MAVVSSMELPGSPIELPSWAPATACYWDPTPELEAGETISGPSAAVLRYAPAYPNDTQDVTATALLGGGPTLGGGSHAGQVVVTFAAGALAAGYEYRVQLSCLGSLGTNPARYFRVRCLL